MQGLQQCESGRQAKTLVVTVGEMTVMAMSHGMRPWAGRAALFGCQQCVGFCVHWGSGGHVLLWT